MAKSLTKSIFAVSQIFVKHMRAENRYHINRNLVPVRNIPAYYYCIMNLIIFPVTCVSGLFVCLFVLVFKQIQ